MAMSPLAALRLGALLLVAGRLAQGAGRRPPLAAVATPTAGELTVVIPARDEAGRIAPCLRALAADPAVGRVLVVDDGSRDGTAELARSLGAEVLDAGPLPAGWAGKPWALRRGLEASSTPWVLCLDADTEPRPGLAGAMLDAARGRDLTLLSAGARFTCPGVALQALHAAMLTTLLVRFPPPGTRLPVPPRRRLANGQCLLLHRERLRGAGGLELVRGSLTEDVALARALARRGLATDFLDATRLCDVRMHRDVAAAWREWGRSLPLVDAAGRADLALDLATVWLTLALPWLRLASRRGDGIDVAALLLRAALVAATTGAYAPPRRGVLLAPLCDVAVAGRLTWGTLRPGRRWRGRTYARPQPLRRSAPPGRS